MSDNSNEIRSQGWCFTLNNYTPEDTATCELLTSAAAKAVTYSVIGKERGELRDTPHYQGFVYFKSLKSLKQVTAILARAHWEKTKGTIDQASDYCKKDKDFREYGTKPMSNKRKGECGKQSIAERWELAKKGKFEELPPEMIKTYEYIRNKNMPVADRSELDNIWICGPSGAGKSSYARREYPGLYPKGMSKWWDGYVGEDVVLLEDFEPRHAEKIGYFLKIWADHYTFNAEIKGGMMKIRPKTILVTSQYTIEACFPDRETQDALNRRFKTMMKEPDAVNE